MRLPASSAPLIAIVAAALAPLVLTGAPTVTGCSASLGVGPGGVNVPALVFIRRATSVTQSGSAPTYVVTGDDGQLVDASRYVPGGSLVLLTPPQIGGKVTSLTAAFPTADFNGADLSFDASTVVFSMKKDANDTYHLYSVSLTPSAKGAYQVHQLTAGAQDDVSPVFLPGQLIGFATNQMYTAMGARDDEYEHARAVMQLATVSVTSGDADRRLFPQSLSHALSPFARHDGTLGYSRWEHLGGTDDIKIFASNPDGTGVVAVAGEHGKPASAIVEVRETSTPNVLIGVATDLGCTLHAGALVRIDARNQADPTCLDPSANQSGHSCLDEQDATFTLLSPGVPTTSAPSSAGRYRDPVPLSDGRILASWADGYVNDLDEAAQTPPDFGIYVFDPATGQNTLVYNDQTTWDLNPLPVVPRAEPPVVTGTSSPSGTTDPVLIGSIDIKTTSLDDTTDGTGLDGFSLATALEQAVGVRIVEGYSTESAVGAPWFGLTMNEGAAILGTATVYSDGSWLAKVPPYLPVRLQPVDKFGLAIRTERLWIQGAPGEDRRCVGCHESRTGASLQAEGTTLADKAQAQDFTEAVGKRTEVPWVGAAGSTGDVQTILTARCASCHNGQTSEHYGVPRPGAPDGGPNYYPVPTLDLSDTPVAVYYDATLTALPASYISVFYPALLAIGQITWQVDPGALPPLWGVPEDARNSALVKKINVRAGDGSLAWPGAPLHPEDMGAAYGLSDDERQTIIRSIDLGGQYWCRQNTSFHSFPSDPLGSSSALP